MKVLKMNKPLYEQDAEQEQNCADYLYGLMKWAAGETDTLPDMKVFAISNTDMTMFIINHFRGGINLPLTMEKQHEQLYIFGEAITDKEYKALLHYLVHIEDYLKCKSIQAWWEGKLKQIWLDNLF